MFLDWLNWQSWDECNCTVFQQSRYRQCKWDECNVQNETEYCTGQCPGGYFLCRIWKSNPIWLKLMCTNFFAKWIPRPKQKSCDSILQFKQIIHFHFRQNSQWLRSAVIRISHEWCSSNWISYLINSFVVFYLFNLHLPRIHKKQYFKFSLKTCKKSFFKFLLLFISSRNMYCLFNIAYQRVLTSCSFHGKTTNCSII